MERNILLESRKVIYNNFGTSNGKIYVALIFSRDGNIITTKIPIYIYVCVSSWMPEENHKRKSINYRLQFRRNGTY